MVNEFSIKVRLVTVNDVHDFAFTANKLKCSVYASHNEYRVNAKSLLGLLSLNLSEPITVTFTGLQDSEDINEFNRWIVVKE